MSNDPRPPCPDVGGPYYPSFDEYCGWDAVNISTLCWASVSAEHLRAAIDGIVDTDSYDKKFGRAVHCRLLEPERYHDEFLVASPCCAVLSSGQRKGETCGNRGVAYTADGWFCGTHSRHLTDAVTPDDFVSEDEATKIERIAAKVHGHKVVRLLRQHGGCEASFVWELDGTICKGRVDKHIPAHDKFPAAILDIKKVQRGRGGPEAFGKACVSYSYVTKAAWYCDGVQAVTGETPLFVWVVVEDDEPHSVAVYQAQEWQLSIGRVEYQNHLARFRECLASDEWPGYSSNIEPLQLPSWYERQYADIQLPPRPAKRDKVPATAFALTEDES